jgi:hypothetical protein
LVPAAVVAVSSWRRSLVPPMAASSTTTKVCGPSSSLLSRRS